MPNDRPLWSGVGSSLPEALLPREPHGPLGMSAAILPAVAAVLAAPTPTPTPAPFAGCASWTYHLHFDLPSRMAMIKNALGNAVTLVTSYSPPGTGLRSDWPDVTTAPNWNYPGRPNYDHGGSIGYTVGYDQGSPALQNDWAWTVTWGFDVFGGVIYRDDPGIPFTAYDSTVDVSGGSIPGVTGRPLAAVTPGSWTILAPQDVVGRNKDRVNWGLQGYYDIAPTIDATNCDFAANYQTLVPIDPNDTGVVSGIETAMQLAYYGGLSIPRFGGTPTRGGLVKAKDHLSNVWPTDPKNRCDRAYGVILCTDGLSNTCNPAGDPHDPLVPAIPPDIPPDTWLSPGEQWVSPCLGFFGRPGDEDCTNPASPKFGHCCDQYSKSNGSGYDCNASYASSYGLFPAGIAEDIYKLNLDTAGRAPLEPVKPRTFVVGISPVVGRCELNYTAYRGRTDAASPNLDAGFDTDNDPRIPHTTEDGTSPDRYGTNLPANKDWAFFALDAKAMARAFITIVNASATGDFTTTAPVSGAIAGAGTTILLPSSEFPKWRGHIYAIDTKKLPSDPLYVQWDAGNVLSNPAATGYVAPASRKLYTWDPATGALVAITAANQDALATLAGKPNPSGPNTSSFNTKVIDFMRGNNGKETGTGRSWRLGASINSTPAVVGDPEVFKQGRLPDHQLFETTYGGKKRTGLAWIGSDDGFLHAWNFIDGSETLAIIPPNLLAAQIDLLANYELGLSDTGQDPDLDAHIWGFASSLRFQDIWDGTKYRTIGYISQGPAGTMMAAVDITHPTPTDPNFMDFGGDPVKILWTKSQADFAPVPLLFNTWSVPAVAASSFSTARLMFGHGYNTASTAAGQQDASFFTLDAYSGLQIGLTKTLAALGLPAPLVGQQSFADTVFFDTRMPTYYPDNISTLAAQADLNGRVWFNYDSAAGTNFPDIRIGIDLVDKSGESQPIYYSPAATGLGRTGCQLYALASGSLYEMSPAVTGRNVGQPGNFIPRFYIATNNQTAPTFNTTIPNGQIEMRAFTSVARPAGDPGGPGNLGPRSQVTASPFLLVPITGVGESQALFLVYDPDNGCVGQSYVVIVSFRVDACTTITVTQTDVFGAGPGAVSGFAIAGTEIVVAKSGVGKNQTAGLYRPGVNLLKYGNLGAVAPVYWRELK